GRGSARVVEHQGYGVHRLRSRKLVLDARLLPRGRFRQLGRLYQIAVREHSQIKAAAAGCDFWLERRHWNVTGGRTIRDQGCVRVGGWSRRGGVTAFDGQKIEAGKDLGSAPD